MLAREQNVYPTVVSSQDKPDAKAVYKIVRETSGYTIIEGDDDDSPRHARTDLDGVFNWLRSREETDDGRPSPRLRRGLFRGKLTHDPEIL
jgi:hypothetical protein